MTLDIAVLTGILLAIGLILFHTLVTGVPPTPTSGGVRRTLFRVLEEIPPHDPQGVVYELGSGWGGLAFAIARRYPRATVRGIEASLLPWAASRLRLALRPQANLIFRRGNFHDCPLGDAALVVCYLFPEGMKKLKPKLEAELADGALVASNTFAMAGWKPERMARAGDIYSSPVYLYRMPPPVSDYEPPASAGNYFGHNP